MCQNNHGLYSCQRFLNLSIKNRKEFIQKKGLCFNCIKSKHMVKDCTSNSMCRYCESKHNSLLHETKQVDKNNNQFNKDDQSPGFSSSSVQKLTLCNNVERSGIHTAIIPTAVVLVSNISDQFEECRILLDTGSQVNLISESCVQRLRLRRSNANISIKGVGTNKTDCTKGAVEINIK